MTRGAALRADAIVDSKRVSQVGTERQAWCSVILECSGVRVVGEMSGMPQQRPNEIVSETPEDEEGMAWASAHGLCHHRGLHRQTLEVGVDSCSQVP